MHEDTFGELVDDVSPSRSRPEIAEPAGESWDEATVDMLYPGLARQAKARFSQT